MSWGVALAAAGSQLLGGYMQSQAQKEANEANRDIANDQMKFQEGQSSTAYQRAMRDMKEAGLNPMLAYSQGGASTGGGASTTIAAENMAQGLEKGVHSAMESKRLSQELEAKEASIALDQAATENQRAQEYLNTTNAVVGNTQRNINVIEAQRRQVQLDAEKEEAKARKSRARADKLEADLDAKAATTDAILKRLKTGTGIINDATSIVKPKIQIGGPSSDTHPLQKGTRDAKKRWEEFNRRHP